MDMNIVAAIVTFIVGSLSTMTLGSYLNWPDAGAIAAIAVMGFFILKKLDYNKEKK